MIQASWTAASATLSDKNACKEFALEESEIREAIKAEKLQYKINYAHGNPYYKLLREEVVALVLELRGESAVKIQKLDFELKKATQEINRYKRKISSLEKERQRLLNQKEELTSK